MEINIIFIFVAILSFYFGLYTYNHPDKVIKFQQKMYALVNWRMEPINKKKEIRNTRIMGMTLVVLVILACLYVAFTGS